MKKRILFLTYDFPYPFNSGGKIRAFNLLQYAGKGFDIHLFSFTRGEISERQQKKLHDIGIEHMHFYPRPAANRTAKMRSIFSRRSSIFKSLYFSPMIERQILDIIQQNDIDILHAESFYTSFFINDRIKQTGVKTVFGTENIEYQIYDDYVHNSAHPALRRVYRREVGKIKNEEIAALANADSVIAVTPDDARIFDSYSEKPSRIIENGIDLKFFSYLPKKKTQKFTLLFVGNFKYFPNIEAAKLLYEHIYKKLPKEKFELVIVGKNVEKLSIPMERGIKLIDYVEDIRDVYKSADVLVSPVTMGGGTSFKTLEAMATGVPIIAHEVRLKPLGAVNGKHYLAANTPAEFIEKISFIKDNPKKAEVMTSQARKFVEKNYGWDIIGKKLADVWKKL